MSKKTKMPRELDLMAQLPREICTQILSRLPIRSIIQSKLVCPHWRDLIESPEFAQFVPCHHLLEFPLMSSSRNPIHKSWPWPYKIHELLGFNISIVRIGVSNSIPLVRSSVNGLILLLHRHSSEQQHLWVCNPITREYLTIPKPPHFINYYFEYGSRGALAYPNHPNYGNYNFGFGVSRRSNEYKVVWVSGRSEWHVFTLGLGARWRTLSEGPTLGRYDRWNMECALITGNLYWLDPEITASRFWCFDLETEVFTTFSAPPPPPPPCQSYRRTSCVLKECLCLCDMSLRSAGDAEIEVWLMSNRGIGKEGNWSKEYVIREGFNRRLFANLFPFKVLEDGLLLGKSGQPDVHHSNFINGVRRSLYTASSIPFPVDWYPRAAVYSPNFLPLKTLLKDMEEEVQSLWTPLT